MMLCYWMRILHRQFGLIYCLYILVHEYVLNPVRHFEPSKVDADMTVDLGKDDSLVVRFGNLRAFEQTDCRFPSINVITRIRTGDHLHSTMDSGGGFDSSILPCNHLSQTSNSKKADSASAQANAQTNYSTFTK